PICQLLYILNPPNKPKRAPRTNTALERALKFWAIRFFPSLISCMPGGVWAKVSVKSMQKIKAEIRIKGKLLMSVNQLFLYLDRFILCQPEQVCHTAYPSGGYIDIFPIEFPLFTLLFL